MWGFLVLPCIFVCLSLLVARNIYFCRLYRDIWSPKLISPPVFSVFGHLSKTLVKLDGQSFMIEFNSHLVFVAMETFLSPAETQLSATQTNTIRHYAGSI